MTRRTATASAAVGTAMRRRSKKRTAKKATMPTPSRPPRSRPRRPPRPTCPPTRRRCASSCPTRSLPGREIGGTTPPPSDRTIGARGAKGCASSTDGWTAGVAGWPTIGCTCRALVVLVVTLVPVVGPTWHPAVVPPPSLEC